MIDYKITHFNPNLIPSMHIKMTSKLTHLPLGDAAAILNFKNCFREHFLLDCPQVNDTRPSWRFVNIGLGNSLLSSGTSDQGQRRYLGVTRPRWGNNCQWLKLSVIICIMPACSGDNVTNIEFKVWIRNYIHRRICGVIVYPRPILT